MLGVAVERHKGLAEELPMLFGVETDLGSQPLCKLGL